MPEIMSLSAKEILLLFGKQNRKARWKTWIRSKKFINIHHDCMSESSNFIIWLLKVLMFGNGVGILALLFCLSWLYH